MRNLKLALLAIALTFISVPAQAFFLSVEYHGTVEGGNVDVDGEPLWGYDEGDEVTGTFIIDLDMAEDGYEFIESTHAPSGPNIDIVHEIFEEDFFEVDTDNGDAEMFIFNVGGTVDDEEESGLLLAELLEAGFATSFLDDLDIGRPVWIDGDDLEFGYALIGALFLTNDGEGEEIYEIEISSLHLELTTAALPEPGTLGLMSLGLLGMGLLRRKKAA